jgi:prepilin-type processing-associated H-X9-DG protein
VSRRWRRRIWIIKNIYRNWKIEQAGYYESSDHGSSVFGANHTGVCNFLFGDGSVHGLSHTTSRNILVPLSVVDDGVSVSLP